MKLREFKALPLLRTIFFVDRASGLPYVCEVRGSTQLTLRANFPLRTLDLTANKETQHHDTTD